MKTSHWAIVAAILVAVWLGFMVWMSSESYKNKDPKRIVGYQATTNQNRQ